MPNPPENLSDYALQAIRQDLIEGRLAPGQRVAADEIARHLHISHIPVREALRFLEAEGHLERDPRTLTRVRPTTQEEGIEIYHLRHLLESDIHAYGVPELNDEDLAELDAQYEAMAGAVDRGDIAAYARANRAFHFVAFERAGRPWTLRFVSNVWDAAARYQTTPFSGAGWEHVLQEQHASLLAAFRARDVEAVNALMRAQREVTIQATGTFAPPLADSKPVAAVGVAR